MKIPQILLKWFKKNQRDLPWRRTYDPYQVWVSEIMLQQTQVKTVLPYFERWMKSLPTIESVAQADEGKILKLWEGLGYYSRARNLQKAAQIIVEEHGGKFPESHNDILKLPGIGPYTAGAIASIAFNQEKPIVDGNIIRLIARLKNDARNTRDPKVLKEYWQIAQEWIPKKEARNFNQAMMEFGALICTPKNPECSDCPLKSHCKALKRGTVDRLPNRGPAQEKVDIQVAIAIIQKSNKIFIQKREKTGLMGGLWEFPGGKLKPKETPAKALHREIEEELGITLKNVQPFQNIKHAYTNHRVDLHCFLADYDRGRLQCKSAIDHQWIPLDELEKFAFPAANGRLIKSLKKLHRLRDPL